MKAVKATLGIAILVSGIFCASAAFGTAAASTPAAGTVTLYLTENPSGTGGTTVITGAIGDYGKTTEMKVQNGLSVVKLRKGTFEENTAKISAALNAAPTTSNNSTCSFSASATAPVTLLDGTGLYAGISGTLNFTINVGFVLPLYKSGSKKGQCNTSNNVVPQAEIDFIIGTGKVSFS
jgi:hypothetical protein